MNLGSLAVIGVTLTRSYQANINAYQWKQISNDFYYGFNKLAFVAAMMMLVLTILLGHAQTGKHTFQDSYVRAFGKLAYDAALVGPIVITFVYFGQEQSVYLSDPTSLVLGSGHIACNLLAAFVLFIFIEYPLRTSITVFILPKLTHDDVLRRYYEQPKGKLAGF